MLCFNLFHPLWLLLAILGGSSIVVVLGDQIIIDEPPNGAAFHAGATIDIRYRVRFNGMASLNSAAVSIAEADSKKVVSVFPNATWVRTGDGPRSAHDEWEIPYNMPNGSYTMLVTGLANHPCSNNGRPPYNRCNSTLESSVTFSVIHS